jgi:hypothetical protein
VHASKLLVMLLASCTAALAGCYNKFEPACGFRCGPAGACPDDYTCAPDDNCHKNGTPSAMLCGIDAAVDAPPDAPPDASIDAIPDATIDAPPDAAHDAS